MAFEITNPTDEIIYIRWTGKPNREEGYAFLDAFQKHLDAAPHKMYTISDLRDGHIDDVVVINKLSQIAAQHPNFGGGTSFGGDLSAKVHVRLFERLTRRSDAFQSLQDALDELERAKPGVTADVDWNAIINNTTGAER